MGGNQFRFKQFTILQDRCGMKVGTDGTLLGAWVDISGAEKILDIGTGTGLIALMLAQRSPQRWGKLSPVNIDAVEIDINSSIQARENVERSPWSNKPMPEIPTKRILMELSKKKLPLQENSLTIEAKKNIYTPEFITLIKDFYLKY